MVGQSVIFRLLMILAPLLLLESPPADCANILGLFSTISPSHLIVHMSVMRTLADRGHNVTIVSALKPKLVPHENITVIMAPFSEELNARIALHLENSSKEKSNIFYSIMKTMNTLLDSQLEFLKHPNVAAIYEKPQVKYDLLVLGYVMNDFQLGVAAKWDIPIVVSWIMGPFGFIDDQVGNIYDPSYVPSLPMSNNKDARVLDFGLRLRNFGIWICMKAITSAIDTQMNKYYKLAFGQEDSDFPTYHEMRRRISLLFYNYHSLSEGPVRPTVPQSIEIGGIQIKDQPDPLPNELAEFLGNATNGAIFFSLGTNVKATFFQPHIMEAIFNVLARQPLSVIWKWDDLEHKPGQAANIYFNSWLPQDDLLAHPNIKLFITHAGKGGVAEAQYHGVPMLALPIFGDQPANAEVMVASGFGISLDMLTLTEERLEQGINEVLSNSTYVKNVRKFSVLYRDRPLTPRQSVIYWTEYVLRHKGAYHMQSPSLHMHFVARNNLDVCAFVLFIIASSLVVFVFLLRLVYKRFTRSRDKVKKC
ncbi:UDP-glycosyltransferase UGT5 [Drosophila grimshawi]|uniref:GH11567 n=1 Tax=Drosophila grimshawi TaxID=7222 RepID=B4JBJ8_DROGR|nr:UDP-glycosyltransferase UGT5 [Drosophila grimshawi]EDW04021.1 GH11567 [Drosophila grimshawi]